MKAGEGFSCRTAHAMTNDLYNYQKDLENGRKEKGNDMLRLVKVPEVSGSSVRYRYYAEDDNRPGLVELDMNTGEVIVIEQTPFELDRDYPYYTNMTNMAKGKVHQMWFANNLEVEKSFIWG